MFYLVGNVVYDMETLLISVTSILNIFQYTHSNKTQQKIFCTVVENNLRM